LFGYKVKYGQSDKPEIMDLIIIMEINIRKTFFVNLVDVCIVSIERKPNKMFDSFQM